jgi:pimeloyl-ACP methyl ester carboxylesterase
MSAFIYLHGFASSPQSAKAQYFGERFRALGLPLQIPDLNQNDFYHLTLSRQLQQVERLLPASPLTIIGSSFGGLTAAWLGERFPQVERLVLLAPAFQFLSHWQPKISPEQMQRWQTEGSMQVYHYGAHQMLPLSYQWMTDMAQYNEANLKRPVPTLILHGLHDDVIPVQSSRDYAATRPWVRLIEFNSDHALVDVQSDLWQSIQTFCHL